MKRIYNVLTCAECGADGKEIRRVDTGRRCAWSIIAQIGCDNGHMWATYIRDESRITPFDIEEEE